MIKELDLEEKINIKKHKLYIDETQLEQLNPNQLINQVLALLI